MFLAASDLMKSLNDAFMLLQAGGKQAVHDDAVEWYQLDHLQSDYTGELLSRAAPTDLPAISQAGNQQW